MHPTHDDQLFFTIIYFLLYCIRFLIMCLSLWFFLSLFSGEGRRSCLAQQRILLVHPHKREHAINLANLQILLGSKYSN